MMIPHELNQICRNILKLVLILIKASIEALRIVIQLFFTIAK